MEIFARGNPVGRAGVTALLVLAALPTVLLAAVPPEEGGGPMRGRSDAAAGQEPAPAPAALPQTGQLP